MDLIVYLNDNFVKTGEAKVSIYDHGFLYGDGAFETLRAYKHHIFKYQDHIQRLHESLKILRLELPISPSKIFKAIKLLLQYNQLNDAYVKIMVTRGEGPMSLDISLCAGPTILVVAEMIHKIPQNWYISGVSTVIVSSRKIPDACMPNSIKSCNYLMNILSKKEATEKGAQEGIFLNMEGYVAEGTSTNIFMVKDKTLLTPAVSSGILDGITRRTVIELAENRGIRVIESHLLPKQIFTADECFMTNTSMEIVPVTYCDGTQINEGQPGKITRLLMKDYKKNIEKQIEQEKAANV